MSGFTPFTGDEEAVELEVDWSDEPMPIYTNGAQILHTPREFSVAYTEYAPFAGRREKPHPVRPGEVPERARVVSALRMTPDVFFQVVAIAASNWNRFVDRFGDPARPMPKFKLIGGGSFQLDGVDDPSDAPA